MKSILLTIATFSICIMGKSQTTIINSSNATGTSGANGSFENATSTFSNNGWTNVNGATNRWFVGTFSSCVGSKGAYVGTASTNNNYTNTVSDVSHFYKDVTFPAGETCITLTFNWKGQGESGWDGLQLFLGSTTATPVGGIDFTTTDGSAVQLGSSFYNLQAACVSASITISAANAGTTKRLVFSWKNDNSVGTNPGATIDGISLVSQAPSTPICATIVSPANLATGIDGCGSATLNWAAVTGCNAATSYDVYFGTSATPPYVTNTASNSYLPNLTLGVTYYWQIRPKNASGTSAGCAIWRFTTTSSTNSEFNLVDDATSSTPYTCTTLTTSINDQRGCAWDANSTLNFASSFSYDFTINLGASDGGADGLTFVMQNDPLGRCKCGTTGEDLGAGGILNSVIIEIDTYMNTNDRDDFTTNFIGCSGVEQPDHLDVWFNGDIEPNIDGDCNTTAVGERPATPTAIRLQTGGANYNIENGLDHKLRIAWNAGTSTLTATVMNNAATITYGVITSIFNPITVFGTNRPYYGFTGSTGGLSNTQTFCGTIVVLPVDGAKMEASCENLVRNIVWTTVAEENNDYFTIEKTKNGIDFEEMSVIDGAGNSTTPRTYEWSDTDPIREISYYRLNQTDYNGVKRELDFIAVDCKQEEDKLAITKVVTNSNNIELEFVTNLEGIHSVQMIDLLGNRIYINEGNFVKGENGLLINKENLSNSIYLFIINNMNETIIEKVFLYKE